MNGSVPESDISTVGSGAKSGTSIIIGNMVSAGLIGILVMNTLHSCAMSAVKYGLCSKADGQVDRPLGHLCSYVIAKRKVNADELARIT